MSNRFDWGHMPVRGGFLGWFRMVHRSENFILRDGKLDIIFPTADAAELAAGRAAKAYINSPIYGITAETAGRFSDDRRKAELIFLPKRDEVKA